MNTVRIALSAFAIATALVLGGCAAEPTAESDGPPPPTPTVTPSVVVDTADLEGDEFTIGVGEAMAIDVDGNPDAYRALLIDASIAEFYAGTSDGLQPTIVGVKPGTTEVVVGDPSKESEEISFTVVVTE